MHGRQCLDMARTLLGKIKQVDFSMVQGEVQGRASEKAGRKEEIRKMERERESSNKKILEEEARRKGIGYTGRRTY